MSTTATAPREITTDDLSRYELKFETKSCSRCGGGGHYSYCQRFGTTCFGCGGSGEQLSRKGQAARERYDEAFDELMTVPAAEIQVGDKVYETVGMTASKRWHDVLGVERTGKSAGRYRIGGEDAEWIVKPEGIIITMEYRGKHRVDHHTDVEAKVHRYDRDAMAQVWNRALTLSGCWLQVKDSQATDEERVAAAQAEQERQAAEQAAEQARLAKAERARQAKLVKRDVSRHAVVAEHPELAVLLDVEQADALGSFVSKVATDFRTKGTLSEKQIEAVKDAIAKGQERNAQRDAERAAAQPAPTGRVVVTGKVVSVKDYEGDFGTTWKMTVLADDGYRVFVTIPRDIDPEVGQRVQFTATLAPAEDDPTFAKGSRPVKGAIL